MAAGLTRALASRLLLGAAVLLVATGCAARPKGPTYPPADVTPAPAGIATDATRTAVVNAIGVAGLQAIDPTQGYRPPEGAWFASAPRTILQVAVPNEDQPRFIVIYAFGTPDDAAAAAADQASYVSHGAGRVMFPNDSHFTIRVLDATAIFFTWSPGSADPRTLSIQQALETVGTGVGIPS